MSEEDLLAEQLRLQEQDQKTNSNGGSDEVVSKTQTPPPPQNKGTEGNATLEPGSGQTTYHKDFWGNATTKTSTVAPEPDEETETPAGTGSPADTPQPGTTKVSKQAVNAGARAAVASINLAQITLCRPLLNWRFRKESEKRFGDKLDRAMELAMGDERVQNPEEKTLKGRFDRWLAQRDKKVKEIPFNDDEEQDMEYAFKTYFEVTNKSMSPEVILVTTLVSILGKRAIDVALWD